MRKFMISEMNPNFPFALRHFAAAAVDANLPHFRNDFPATNPFNFDIGLDDDIVVVKIQFKDSGVPAGGNMKPELFDCIKSIAGSARCYKDLSSIEGLRPYFAWDRFILVLDVIGDAVNAELAEEAVLDWLEDAPLARATQFNSARVQAAIPAPPQYSLDKAISSMWVIECDETIIQGTAFDLDAYGTVTNAHVVEGATALMAFRAKAPITKFPVRVIKQNTALDIAIIEVISGGRPSPLLVETDEVLHMAHVAVCGFPNYRVGDSGVLTPGLIVGTRPRSGVQRLLTNAPIVTGMSGGPALGASGNVIGICTSGASSFGRANETEDHSIIPIAALELLET